MQTETKLGLATIAALLATTAIIHDSHAQVGKYATTPGQAGFITVYGGVMDPVTGVATGRPIMSYTPITAPLPTTNTVALTSGAAVAGGFSALFSGTPIGKASGVIGALLAGGAGINEANIKQNLAQPMVTFYNADGSVYAVAPYIVVPTVQPGENEPGPTKFIRTPAGTSGEVQVEANTLLIYANGFFNGSGGSAIPQGPGLPDKPVNNVRK